MSPENDRVVATARATLLATSRLEAEIRAGEFVGLADDPGAGAPGAGPTPTEYLMMALASCTATTLRATRTAPSENSPVTLLLQFAWGVRTDITNGPGELTTSATMLS